MASRFEAAMRLMRRHDPQVREDGFGRMREIAADHVPELIAAFQAESDHGLRCWLLELIGGTGLAQTLDVLVDQLHGDDESLRDWAVHGLKQLDSPAARTAIYRAPANRPPSAGLLMRPAQQSDVSFLEALHQDPDYAFFAVDQTPSRVELEAQIRQAASPCTNFLIVCRGVAGPRVGWLRLDLDRANGVAKLGYGFARQHWGRGYATTGVRTMVDQAFERESLYKIWARVDPRNGRSIRVLLKSGFRVEGVLESHYVRRGERVDRMLFGLTRSRWSALKQDPSMLNASPRPQMEETIVRPQPI